MSKCSRVWTAMPSSAAMTNRAASMLRGAGDHGLDELLVAGDVDEDDLLLVVRVVEEDEAELDRHAPLFFLGQGVGVDAGQGPDEGALAVVDVAGRADDDVVEVGHGREAGAEARRRMRAGPLREDAADDRGRGDALLAEGGEEGAGPWTCGRR